MLIDVSFITMLLMFVVSRHGEQDERGASSWTIRQRTWHGTRRITSDGL